MHANPFPFMEHFNTFRTRKSGLKLQLHNKRKETIKAFYGSAHWLVLLVASFEVSLLSANCY